MIISQDGVFTVGSSGQTVECDLLPLETGKLTGVTAVQLTLTRPDNTSTSRALSTPACIIDSTGKIQFSSVPTDWPTMAGVYTIRLDITFPTGPLVVTGDFTVDPITPP